MWGECKDGLKIRTPFFRLLPSLPCFDYSARSFPVSTVKPFVLKFLVFLCSRSKLPVFFKEEASAFAVYFKRLLNWFLCFTFSSKHLFSYISPTSNVETFSLFCLFHTGCVCCVCCIVSSSSVLFVVQCFLVFILNVFDVSCLHRFPNQLPSVFKHPTSCFRDQFELLTSHVFFTDFF